MTVSTSRPACRPNAEPGAVCVGKSVYDQVLNKLDIAWRDLGELELKNIRIPVHAYQPIDGQTPNVKAHSPIAGPAKLSSIAVLPLVSMSGDRLHEYLADGLTEDIITLLARIPGFLVISRTSTFAYKGESPDVREVGRELGVRYVVEGSLRPVGKSFRVTIQLIDAESGNHIWADKFDLPTDEIDEAQDRITRGIVAKLEPELTRAELKRVKRRAPSDLDAWALYVRAHGPLVAGGWHEDTVEEACGLLRKAISADPEFALAHGYLSLILALGWVFGLTRDPDKARAEAKSAAEQALKLDGDTSSVLGYAGCAISDLGQRERGIELLERAIENDPSNAQAWVALGAALALDNRVEDGVEKLRQGIKISPADPRLSFWETFLAHGLLRLDQLDEATSVAQSACRRDDKLHFARVILAATHAASGRTDKAAQALQDAKRIRPELSKAEIARLVGPEMADTLIQAETAA